MKKHIYKYRIIYLMLFVVGLILSGCEKDEELSDMPGTLFRPRSFTAEVYGNEVSFSWIPIANATYVIELSRDSLLFTNDLQQIEISDTTGYELEGLYNLTQYSARIKAVSKDGTVNDSGYSALAFMTGLENIFYSISEKSVGFDFIKVEWNSSKAADKIVVCTTDSIVVQTVMLTSENKEAGELLIENLDESTTYIFQIYNGEVLRGTRNFSTYSSYYSAYVDQSQNPNGYYYIGTYYMVAEAGAYVEISDENTTGVIIADAFKFTKVGYSDIVVDNVDDNVVAEGGWSISAYSAVRIGDNYSYKYGSGLDYPTASIKYYPDLPESGQWNVYMYYNSSSSRDKNVPVHIYVGDH